MGIYGNPGKALIQGAEAGQDRQQKQELLKMQKQSHKIQMETQDNANYEMNLLRSALEEEKQNTQNWKQANLMVSRDQSINEYIGSLKADTFSNPTEFGGDITKIQDFSRIASPNKKPPQIPNMADDRQVRQIVNMLRQDMGEDAFKGVKETDLWEIAKTLGMSGEYIAVGEAGNIIYPVDKIYGALGAQMNTESQTKFNSFMDMKNQIMLASKGKLAGDGSAEDGNLKLYNQLQSDKNLRDEIVDSGGSVPQQLTNRIAHNENVYSKENIGAASAETQRKNRNEYTKAIKDEQDGKLYKGGADDVQHFNTLQIKDKEKKFGNVQKEVESFRTFKTTKDRLNDILGQATIDRDAVSNVGFKIQQYLGDEASGFLNKIKGGSKKSVEELMSDKKAMAAFNRIETAVGFPMVMLIKEISGAAVTNEEREYLMNLVIGGEFKNMDALTEKLDEFVNTLGERAKKSLNKRISGGKALRPNWGDMVEQEINEAITKGEVGSTIIKAVKPTAPVIEKTIVDKTIDKAKALREQAKGLTW